MDLLLLVDTSQLAEVVGVGAGRAKAGKNSGHERDEGGDRGDDHERPAP